MNVDIKKLVIGILSVIIAVLGGTAYQTSSSLNEVQKNVTQLSKNMENMITSKMVSTEETE